MSISPEQVKISDEHRRDLAKKLLDLPASTSKSERDQLTAELADADKSHRTLIQDYNRQMQGMYQQAQLKSLLGKKSN